jgi:glycosyltransferase involved in cell wall biosynthesis
MKASQRIVSYASFAATSTFGMRYLRYCDAILVHSTPVTPGIGPAIRRVFRNRPVVTMVQDLWPETLLHSGFAGDGLPWRITQSLAKSVSDAIYRRSDAIAVISPGMIEALVERGIDREKVHLIHNWVPPELLPQVNHNPKPAKDKGRLIPVKVIYAGNLGDPQAVPTILEAASILRDRKDIEFVFVGSGVLEQELKDRALKEGLNQVRFLGVRPITEVATLVTQSDIQLVTLAPSKIFEITIPSKLQFSLGFGRAIVAAVNGDPAVVARESGAAIVCPPGNSAELAKAISQAANLTQEQREIMGQSGRNYFDQHFTEKVGGDALSSLLQTVIENANRKG